MAPSATASAGLGGSKDDICPVCKSSRYFNPSMQLLVSPECWHRMCETCVSRIFGHGPAQCPIAGCKKTLRKHRFRKQTFEDIQVEREVDIRREVADVMNRREEDFETLKDYNDYLEQCENMTFNLINNVDVQATRKALEQYRTQNKSSIAANAARENEENAAAVARSAAEREAAKLRRKAALREAEEEKQDLENSNRDMIDRLAREDGDASAIVRDSAKVRSDRIMSKRKEFENGTASGSAQFGSNGTAEGFVIRGLKKREAPKAAKPYSPFAGVHYKRQYSTPRDNYSIAWLDKIKEEVTVTAGGYDVNAYCQRALVDAFAGLGVFVGDELANRSQAAIDAPST